jgi:hypothetical protein
VLGVEKRLGIAAKPPREISEKTQSLLFGALAAWRLSHPSDLPDLSVNFSPSRISL